MPRIVPIRVRLRRVPGGIPNPTLAVPTAIPDTSSYGSGIWNPGSRIVGPIDLRTTRRTYGGKI